MMYIKILISNKDKNINIVINFRKLYLLQSLVVNDRLKFSGPLTEKKDLFAGVEQHEETVA